MSFYAVVHFANLFFAGILAGIEVGIHYGIGAPPEGLRERGQIQLRQSMVLRVLIPVSFVMTAISAVAVAVLDGNSSGYLFRCAGLLALVIWVISRVIGTVPINASTSTQSLRPRASR